MNRLGRREIPPLIPRISRLGKAGTLRRSFPSGPSEYFRVYNSEPLHLEVTLLKEQQDLTLVLHSNLGSHDDVWHDIRFDQVAPQTYAVDVPVETCGYFKFRLKYTLDGGRTWCWDRAPFSEVLVDPANTRDTLMYTLIPTASGHIGQWKEQLHHIHAMHFNSVHLLPVTQMGDSNSPYAAANLFEVDASYLDPSDPRQGLDQFEDFVDTVSRKRIPNGKERILLVEDDDQVREIASTLLTALGYHVLRASSGPDALALIDKQTNIDLLFTDMVMPGGMTGAELADEARRRIPNLKVLYTSGYTSTTVFDNELLTHFDDILNKPYRQEDLAQSVRDVLDRE